MPPSAGKKNGGAYNSIPTYIARLFLTNTGTSTIGLFYHDRYDTLRYLLSFPTRRSSDLQREPGDGPEALTPGQSSYGHIGPNDYDTFSFVGASNDVIYLKIGRAHG